jgi:hypothetical protein
MPLIPAILPFNHNSITDARPIRIPPISPLKGVKSSNQISFRPSNTRRPARKFETGERNTISNTTLRYDYMLSRPFSLADPQTEQVTLEKERGPLGAGLGSCRIRIRTWTKWFRVRGRTFGSDARLSYILAIFPVSKPIYLSLASSSVVVGYRPSSPRLVYG